MYMNALIADWQEAAPRIAAARKSAKPVPLKSVSLLPPNPCPVHVIAAPANYRKHIGEIGARSVSKGRTAEQQGFFMKARTLRASRNWLRQQRRAKYRSKSSTFETQPPKRCMNGDW